MRAGIWTAAVLAAALGTAACAQTQRPEPAAAAPPASAAAPSSAAVAPIRYTSRTLPNGLRVYAVRDATSPNAAVQVWYGVGGRDDPRGRSGFAHLFEHLMFKATRNMPPETLDRLTEDVGGENNAFTSEDVTAYHEVVPANHLERLLWAEAERMRSLSLRKLDEVEALLERTKAMKGWLEVAKECGCATPNECNLFPAPHEGPVDPGLALRVIRVEGTDCRRPSAG